MLNEAEIRFTPFSFCIWMIIIIAQIVYEFLQGPGIVECMMEYKQQTRLESKVILAQLIVEKRLSFAKV